MEAEADGGGGATLGQRGNLEFWGLFAWPTLSLFYLSDNTEFSDFIRGVAPIPHFTRFKQQTAN